MSSDYSLMIDDLVCNPAQTPAAKSATIGSETLRGSVMKSLRLIPIVAAGIVLCVQDVAAQAPFRYREYTLGSSTASVAQLSDTPTADIKLLHERPARIQGLEWRAPYVPSGRQPPDPVREVRFSFYDDQVYRIVATYDRERMQGLTNDDLIEVISKTYGVPLLRNARTAQNDVPNDMRADTVVVAQWEDPASLLTLTRGTYSSEYQLVLASKALSPRARAAIREALRLDTQEAPQRERALRSKEASDVRAAGEKARVANKAAFKPE